MQSFFVILKFPAKKKPTEIIVREWKWIFSNICGYILLLTIRRSKSKIAMPPTMMVVYNDGCFHYKSYKAHTHKMIPIRIALIFNAIDYTRILLYKLFLGKLLRIGLGTFCKIMRCFSGRNIDSQQLQQHKCTNFAPGPDLVAVSPPREPRHSKWQKRRAQTIVCFYPSISRL